MTAKKMTPKPFQSPIAPAPRNAHIIASPEVRAYTAEVAASLPAWREEQFRRAAGRMRAARIAAYRGPVVHPVRIGDIP